MFIFACEDARMASTGAIRATERFPVRVSIEVVHPRSARRIEAEVCDLSTGGCRIAGSDLLSIGDQLLVTIDGLEPWPAAVAWTAQGCAGVAFHTPLDHSVAEHYSRIFRS
jgi:hypothetical protein